MNPSMRSDGRRRTTWEWTTCPSTRTRPRRRPPPCLAAPRSPCLPSASPLLGIRSEPVGARPAGGALRTVGRVAVDERRRRSRPRQVRGLRREAARRLHGKPVRKGAGPARALQPRAGGGAEGVPASPAGAQARLGDSGVPGVAEGGPSWPRPRASGCGYSTSARTEIAAPRAERRRLPDGRPCARRSRAWSCRSRPCEGMKVSPADRLYEHRATCPASGSWPRSTRRTSAACAPGAPARVTPARPARGANGSGTRHLLSPDREARDAHRARSASRWTTADGVLKPDMFADVTSRAARPPALTVPESAVIQTGERTLVFVDQRRGALRAARGRRSGAAAGGYEVRAGVAAGERVVVVGQLPDRLRVEPARRASARAGGTADMVRAHHPLQRGDKFLVLALTAVAVVYGIYAVRAHPARRHPRPLGHPGDRLLALGPQPRHHRGPGHLPDRDRAPRRAAGEGDPRLLRLRLLLRLRHLPGRHRPLLGAQPRARVPEQDPAAPARGRRAPSSGPTRPASAGSSSTRSSTDSGTHDLAELRSLQDWYLRYRLQAVPGVAEVASVGGFVKQYQVTVDPNRLRAYGLPLTDVVDAVRKSNEEVGGRLLELSGREFMVRGRGYVQVDGGPRGDRGPQDGRRAARRSWSATWRRVALGPEIRRGVGDLDGRGRRGRRHRRHAPRRERPAPSSTA